MNISDVMIHVSENLDSEARSALEAQMRDLDGVIAPRFNSGKDHLLVVAFDPDKSRPIELLGAIQAAGYSAQLIGA
ncbi:MAG: hypothetical protein WC091_21365 [Sulfuricellaceae bacterium]